MLSCEIDVWPEIVRQASSASSSASSSRDTIVVEAILGVSSKEKIIGSNFAASGLAYLTFVSLCSRASPCPFNQFKE